MKGNCETTDVNQLRITQQEPARRINIQQPRYTQQEIVLRVGQANLHYRRIDIQQPRYTQQAPTEKEDQERRDSEERARRKQERRDREEQERRNRAREEQERRDREEQARREQERRDREERARIKQEIESMERMLSGVSISSNSSGSTTRESSTLIQDETTLAVTRVLSFSSKESSSSIIDLDSDHQSPRLLHNFERLNSQNESVSWQEELQQLEEEFRYLEESTPEVQSHLFEEHKEQLKKIEERAYRGGYLPRPQKMFASGSSASQYRQYRCNN